MTHPTAAAAFVVLFVIITAVMLTPPKRFKRPHTPPRHRIYDGPCPAKQAASYGDCWACMNQKPHPSPATCATCGQSPDERHHDAKTGSCLEPRQ